MKSFMWLRFFIIYICTMHHNADAKGIASISSGLTGKGGSSAVVKQMTSFLTSIPKNLEKYMQSLATINASILQTRVMISSPMVTPQALGSIYTTLSDSLFQLQTQIVSFRAVAFLVTLKALNTTCSQPQVMMSMAVPGPGQLVSGLCGKISFLDLKVDGMLNQAEMAISNGLTARENIVARMSIIPGGSEYLATLPAPQPLPMPMATPGSTPMAGGMVPPGMMPPSNMMMPPLPGMASPVPMMNGMIPTPFPGVTAQPGTRPVATAIQNKANTANTNTNPDANAATENDDGVA